MPVMMPVRKGAFADESGETDEKQEYDGTFHDEAFSAIQERPGHPVKKNRFDLIIHFLQVGQVT